MHRPKWKGHRDAFKVETFCGVLLRHHREARSWRRKDLAAAFAEYTGRRVSINTIANWETERTVPSATDMVLLAHVLDVCLDELVGTHRDDGACITRRKGG